MEEREAGNSPRGQSWCHGDVIRRSREPLRDHVKQGKAGARALPYLIPVYTPIRNVQLSSLQEELRLRERQDLPKLTQAEAAEARFEPSSDYLSAPAGDRGQLLLYQHSLPHPDSAAGPAAARPW